MPKGLVAEAQTGEKRDDVEGRPAGKSRAAESAAVTSQGRVLGWCGLVSFGSSVRLCSVCGGEDLVGFTLVHV